MEIVRIGDGTTEIQIAPARGGMVTHFDFGKRPIVFMDEATLADPTKNVRGGSPVLFPSPGPLANDRFAYGTKTGSMKQHGFARTKAWRVTESTPSSVTLVLGSDASTREQYPWDFLLTYRYSVEKTKLRIEQKFENRSKDPMPFAAGFHPYFFVRDAEKPRASVPTGATKAWDNVTKKMIDLTVPIDLGAEEVDLHLIDHGRSDAVLDLGDGRPISLKASPEFQRWVVWTLAGRDFVCLEPWTAGANALNDGQNLIVLPPGETKDLWVEISVAA